MIFKTVGIQAQSVRLRPIPISPYYIGTWYFNFETTSHQKTASNHESLLLLKHPIHSMLPQGYGYDIYPVYLTSEGWLNYYIQHNPSNLLSLLVVYNHIRCSKRADLHPLVVRRYSYVSLLD